MTSGEESGFGKGASSICLTARILKFKINFNKGALNEFMGSAVKLDIHTRGTKSFSH